MRYEFGRGVLCAGWGVVESIVPGPTIEQEQSQVFPPEPQEAAASSSHQQSEPLPAAAASSSRHYHHHRL